MLEFEIFEFIMNIIAICLFIFGIILAIIIFVKKKNATSLFLIALMISGLFYSLGNSIDDFLKWKEADEFVSVFTIVLATILLLIGIVVMVEQKLKDSEEMFRHLFEDTPYSIILFNQNGLIRNCNYATETLFNKKKEDFIGKFISEIFELPNNVSISLKNKLELIDTKEFKEPIEFKFKRKNGSVVWLNLQLSLLKLYNDIFIQAILRDITQQKRIEILKKEEMKKLKALDQMRSELIRRTSHEFKTPLNSIFSTSQYLLTNYKDQISGDILKLIEIINRGGLRLTNLTKNLLDSFNLEISKLELEIKKEDIIRLIKECTSDFIVPIRNREIFLKQDLKGEIYIDMDRNRIAQVVLNLISNAIKNTPPKGLIYISVQPENNYLDIIIKDSGIGLTKEEKGKLFKKFGKIERENIGMNIITEGSGLGLYISKKIIELHNGRILVESEGRNKGSTFIVRMPLYNSENN
ncbi:MAG: ATP-binding protein [Candidatus Hodarchaeota archaeon]